MTFNLQASVATPQDLKSIIQEVKKYARWFSQEAVRINIAGRRSAQPVTLSSAATEIITDSAEGKQLSQQRLDEIIASLEEILETSPRITITLAAPAPTDLKHTLLQWCRKNLSPNILVDFRFNSTLLGGMVVRYGSHVYDWSFRRQILASKEHFPEVLRRV